MQVAIFGFCDIRRFTDATEVLQEGVMEFVNTIAHIVHTAVATRGGAANKNIGDAFLLVWKLPKGLRSKDLQALSNDGSNNRPWCSSSAGTGPPVVRHLSAYCWLLSELGVSERLPCSNIQTCSSFFNSLLHAVAVTP